MTPFKHTIIVGGGLSGLVVAHRLKQLQPNHRLVVAEKGSRPGGVIRSFSDNGYQAEYGPHGFLDNCEESRQLLAETGLDQECLKASLATFVRYVCINGSLMMIPQSPLKIIKAPLIPWKDKFRVLGDLFKKPLEGEPTAAKWAAYRFGRGILPYVDAVFTGTYAGDFNELRMDAVMPGVRALEQQYGSVIRGALKKAAAARRAKSSGKKMTMPAMTSFPGGMQRLPERLAEQLEVEELLLDCTVERLKPIDNGWQVDTTTGAFTATNLVLAIPLNQSLELLNASGMPAPLAGLPEAWLATVVFGFAGTTLPPGFGFLIPESEKRFTLGTLFSSNMFPGRAPDGHCVIETLIGGRRHPERLELDDDILIARALGDIRGLLDLPQQPAYSKVLRPAGGIPQLVNGYTDLLAWRNSLTSHPPGLYVCGLGWEGIGLNDMIKTAVSVAEKAVTGTPQFQAEAVAKKVYF